MGSTELGMEVGEGLKEEGFRLCSEKEPGGWKKKSEKGQPLLARNLDQHGGVRTQGSYLPEHVLRLLKVKVPSCKNMGKRPNLE